MSNYPPQYLLYNAEMSKNLSLVMTIEGVTDVFGIGEAFTNVKYGDRGIFYGLSGLVYGGLRLVSDLKPYMQLDTSLVIQQTIEPEQGRGNIGTITISLIDYNGEVSKIVAPGVVYDEIMGKREVKLFLGFTQTSFPTDYVLIYRGYITSVICPPGLVKLQISDATMKKRQPIFNTPSHSLSGDINNSTLTIPVNATDGFFDLIRGPDGSYDPIVGLFINIDNEWISYGAGALAGTTITATARGQLGTQAAAHTNGTSVLNGIMLGVNLSGVNGVTLALKILLSGWNGPCETDIPVSSLVYSGSSILGNISNCFVLNGIDADKDLGLTVGDYFTITGAVDPSNDLSGVITGFDDNAQGANRVIYTDQTFVIETTSTAVSAFRSKYDTLPVAAGLGCRMRDVDVVTMEFIRDTYLIANANMRFFYNSVQDGKVLIDSQINLPLGCYGISRFGRISMAIAKPPLPGGTQSLVQLNYNNILDPENIIPQRAMNNRNFFNQIVFSYDLSPLTGNYASVFYGLGTDSLQLFDTVVALPIQADGLVSALSGGTIASIRSQALLNRYQNGAILIDLTVNWSAGSTIEVADIVAINDQGNLQIMNFDTGERNLGVQLFEVIDRQLNVFNGNVKLRVLGGVGFSVTDRFGLDSPSSIVGVGSTTSSIKITPSFGQVSLVQEIKKWTPFIGEIIQVHPYDWSTVQKCSITGFNPGDPSVILVSGLSTPPSAGDIVDIDDYGTGTDPNFEIHYKALYSHYSPSIPVTSGVSNTSFNVSVGDIAKMTTGNTIFVRNADYSVYSPEVKVSTLGVTLVTVATSIGFTPSSANTVEGVGFKDGGGFYRYT